MRLKRQRKHIRREFRERKKTSTILNSRRRKRLITKLTILMTK